MPPLDDQPKEAPPIDVEQPPKLAGTLIHSTFGYKAKGKSIGKLAMIGFLSLSEGTEVCVKDKDWSKIFGGSPDSSTNVQQELVSWLDFVRQTPEADRSPIQKIVAEFEETLAGIIWVDKRREVAISQILIRGSADCVIGRAPIWYVWISPNARRAVNAVVYVGKFPTPTEIGDNIAIRHYYETLVACRQETWTDAEEPP